MKKLFYVIMIMFLLVNINVSASNDEGVSLKLECGNLKVARGETVTCDMVITTLSTISIDNVSLDVEHDTDLTKNYVVGQFFTGAFTGNHLVMNSSTLKSGNFKLGKLQFSVSEISTLGKKTIVLRNISFWNGADTAQIHGQTNFTLELEVVSDNNNLESISIDDKAITGFESNKLNYSLESEKEKIKLSATAEDEKTKIEGLGEKTLKYGKNNFEIKATSEKGTVKTYVLEITRPDKRSDENRLKTLTIDGIDLNFQSDTTKYEVYVESDFEKITLKSSLIDEKAQYVKNFDNRDVALKYGKNEVLLKVVSEKGTERVYTIILNREDNRSDVAKLTSLKINGQEISLVDDVYEYKLNLLYRFDKTSVEAVPFEKATIDYKDIPLRVGDNELIIKVISEKETKKEYKITINRLTEEESKAELESIKIIGYDFVFDKEITSYNLEVKKEEQQLNIEFFGNDLERIDHSVSGNRNLKNGSVVTISVKDDLGEYKYTINIIKEENPKAKLDVNEIAYGVLALGAISFISSISYVLVKKGKKK